MKMKNPYEVLGVSENATDAEIKKGVSQARFEVSSGQE